MCNFKVPKEKYKFLIEHADQEFIDTIQAQSDSSNHYVIVSPSKGNDYDTIASAYTDLVTDSLDSEWEATELTYKLEYIWDNYFYNTIDYRSSIGCFLIPLVESKKLVNCVLFHLKSTKNNFFHVFSFHS